MSKLREAINNVEVDDINSDGSVEKTALDYVLAPESIDAILDAIIEALPEVNRAFTTDLKGSRHAKVYSLAKDDIKQLLLEAKDNK